MKVLEKILFAGFGGQGILSIGKIFADACIENDMQASWLPSYGPEMRGGTCNCLVAVSNEPVLSPYFVRPTDAIIMNQASMERFLKTLDTAKVVVINTSLVELTSEMEKVLENVKLVRVDATNIAIELGSVKCANMVMLGAYAGVTGEYSVDTLMGALRHKLGPSKEKFMPANQKAIEAGMAAVRG